MYGKWTKNVHNMYGKLPTINQLWPRIFGRYMSIVYEITPWKKNDLKHESDIPIAFMKFINWIVKRVFILYTRWLWKEGISKETIYERLHSCSIAAAAELHIAYMTCYHNRIENHNCLFCVHNFILSNKHPSLAHITWWIVE